VGFHYPVFVANPVPQPSPFREGFAALREEPLLLAAELTWRWCFGVAAWLIVLLAAALFLDSVRVTALDRFLLGTMSPMLERSALNHIFHGGLLRLVWLKFIVLAALSVLWALAAAVGRAASLRNLIALTSGDDLDEDAGWQFRPMFQLHLVRALWLWIALSCLTASLLLGYDLMQQGRAARGAFFYVFGFSLSLVFGVMLNWIFGLAPVFCIRNQANAGDALALTLDFCTRQAGRLMGLSAAFLAVRIVWFSAMFFLVLAPTGLGKHVALGWQLLLMGLLLLIYFAGADALYVARLGAYAALAEIDAQPAPEPAPLPDPQPWTPYIPPPQPLATSD
jgi:hypothetical protein